MADLLVELLEVLPDTVSFADGITAMHRTGPMNGWPYELGLVACSSNPVALDRALHDIIGLEPGQSPLMQACVHANLVGSDPAALRFPLQNPVSLQVKDFVVPDELIPIRFNPFRFITSSVRRVANWFGIGP